MNKESTKRCAMPDLSKHLTDDRRKKLDYFHYLITHEPSDIPHYDEIVDFYYRDTKKFLDEIMKEFGLK